MFGRELVGTEQPAASGAASAGFDHLNVSSALSTFTLHHLAAPSSKFTSHSGQWQVFGAKH